MDKKKRVRESTENSNYIPRDFQKTRKDINFIQGKVFIFTLLLTNCFSARTLHKLMHSQEKATIQKDTNKSQCSLCNDFSHTSKCNFCEKSLCSLCLRQCESCMDVFCVICSTIR